ncbi:uncharacterized protein [Salvelinus sp. IW2-2015]|uniref:uncharacterized protein n=1 Tax=Salvelinus sp. IW2-2015 TaxID=2691554 RepID=UPI0038D479D9
MVKRFSPISLVFRHSFKYLLNFHSAQPQHSSVSPSCSPRWLREEGTRLQTGNRLGMMGELEKAVRKIHPVRHSDSTEVKSEKLLSWNLAVRDFHILVNVVKVLICLH